MTDDDRVGPGHLCRRDDPDYVSVGECYEAHRGRVPIQAAATLSRLVRERQMSFADAFRTLVDHGALILVEDEAEDDNEAADDAAHRLTMDLVGDGEVDGDLADD